MKNIKVLKVLLKIMISVLYSTRYTEEPNFWHKFGFSGFETSPIELFRSLQTKINKFCTYGQLFSLPTYPMQCFQVIRGYQVFWRPHQVGTKEICSPTESIQSLWPVSGEMLNSGIVEMMQW